MSVPYGLFENMYIQTMCVRVNNKPVNRYTSLENLRLSMDSRKVDYEAAVIKYNTLHSSSFQYLGALKSKQTTAAFKGKSLRKIFAIAQYSPAPNHRISIPCRAKGEDVKINILKEPINFEKKNCLYGIEFYTEEALENFKNFWYGFNLKKQGWKSIKDQEGSLINFIMDCIYTVGGDGPSLNRYKTFFPNVDWSRPWTDEEILEEIGLPKDFLKDIR